MIYSPRHEEKGKDKKSRNHPCRPSYAVLDGKCHTTVCPVALDIRKILRGGCPQQKQTENQADQPGFIFVNGFYRRPAAYLQEYASWYGYRNIGNNTQSLCPQRWCRIKIRHNRCNGCHHETLPVHQSCKD